MGSKVHLKTYAANRGKRWEEIEEGRKKEEEREEKLQEDRGYR